MVIIDPLKIQNTIASACKLALLGGVMLSLVGCGGMQSALGLGKSPPDEFAVVTKAPLVVPPEFSLRPPRPGAPRPQELQPTETARRALLGEEFGEGEEGPSKGEVSLLMRAGADRVDPNIRKVLSDESGGTRKKDEGFADKVLFWRDSESGNVPPKALNARAESERLRSELPSDTGSTDELQNEAGDPADK